MKHPLGALIPVVLAALLLGALSAAPAEAASLPPCVPDGGRIVVNPGQTMAYSNCIVHGNVLSGGVNLDGGGVDNGGTLTLTGVVISGNRTTSNGSGGGIENDGTLTLSNVTISGNSAGTGGGIRNDVGGAITMDHVTIRNNSAVYGAGIMNIQKDSPSTIVIRTTAIVGNTASSDGGGINNSPSPTGSSAGTVTITDSIIKNNSSGGDGGAIEDYLGGVTLDRVTLSGNRAAQDGGAVAEAGTLAATNVTVVANRAQRDGAGIITKTGGAANVQFATIADNVAGDAGGGVADETGMTLQATLLANNRPANCSGAVTSAGYNLDSGASCGLNSPHDQSNVRKPGVASGLRANGGPGLGVNGSDPMLTLALLPGSPAIDAAGTSGPATDERGVARPQGVADDIGAFEYVQ